MQIEEIKNKSFSKNTAYTSRLRKKINVYDLAKFKLSTLYFLNKKKYQINSYRNNIFSLLNKKNLFNCHSEKLNNQSMCNNHTFINNISNNFYKSYDNDNDFDKYIRKEIKKNKEKERENKNNIHKNKKNKKINNELNIFLNKKEFEKNNYKYKKVQKIKFDAVFPKYKDAHIMNKNLKLLFIKAPSMPSIFFYNDKSMYRTNKYNEYKKNSIINKNSKNKSNDDKNDPQKQTKVDSICQTKISLIEQKEEDTKQINYFFPSIYYCKNIFRRSSNKIDKKKYHSFNESIKEKISPFSNDSERLSRLNRTLKKNNKNDNGKKNTNICMVNSFYLDL